jgi:PKD repeat protein
MKAELNDCCNIFCIHQLMSKRVTKMNKNLTRLFFINLIKNTHRLCLSVILLTSTAISATENQSDNVVSTTALQLGNPASFLQKIGLDSDAKAQFMQESINSFTQTTVTNEALTLSDNLGNELKVVSENLSVEANGTISINGHAVGFPNSEFILQGNDESIYGWVILKDQNVAYEYTTENGQLVVDQIAVTDVLPICDLQGHEHGTRTMAIQNSQQALPYPGTHVGQLESKPGASHVIFLDTGNIMSNDTPHDVSKEFVWTTWQIVAASFSMFDVNVTTNQSVYNNAAPSKRGGGTLYRQTGRSSCAFAFGTSTFCTLYKETDAYGQGRTAAHEFGHLLHLKHDGGSPGGEYHQGISDFQWMPIMGNYWFANSWGQALYQWSKGEYSGASNREDDFAIMQGYIPFRVDDIPGSRTLVVATNGDVSAENNTGQIARNTDTDSFTFTIGASGGHANFTIDRSEHIGGAMLDVQAYIKSSTGAIVAQSNKAVNRSASFNRDLSAGNYTLEISGGAEGTPNHGFSKYSSLGYFTISGSITGANGDDNIAPIANFTVLCEQSNCEFDGSSSYDPDGRIISYQWNFGDGNSKSGNKVNHSYLANGDYRVQLTVVDEKNKSTTTEQVVTINVPVADIVLTNNVAITGLSGEAEQQIFFRFSVPEQAKNLSFKTNGGTGDADLVVRYGSHPSEATNDCKSDNSNNDEQCQFLATQSGDYYALLYGYSRFTNVTMTASYETDNGNGGEDPVANFSYLANELNVTFSDLSTGSEGTLVGWQWSFGDGSSSQEQSPAHSYSATGSFVVSLTVTDNEGRSHSQSQNLTITDSNSGCNNLNVWGANGIYQSGDKVSYEGNKYKANWWTRGQVPTENSGQWQVWSNLGNCN